MIPAVRKRPKISEVEPNVTDFLGLNTFGPHADLAMGELRDLENFDLYGPATVQGAQKEGYIKTRRGSQVLIDEATPDLNVLNHTTFDTGDNEFVLIQQVNGSNSEFRFCELVSSGAWTDVVERSDGVTSFTVATTDKVDFSVSNNKIYVFSAEGNSILEWDSASSLFKRRKMGLPAPQISEIVSGDADPVGTGLSGKRVYGVELVFKNTSVTPNVDVIVSGPNRAIALSNPSFKEGRLAYAEGSDKGFTVKVSATLNDGTGITATENGVWTHIRLYRSKDLTSVTNTASLVDGEGEIEGRDNELFQVQEMTRAAFLATLSGGVYTFAEDTLDDDSMPYPWDIVTDDRLDMTVLPSASVGAFHNNRIWVSGVTELPGPNGVYAQEAIESKIFYTAEASTKYSESTNALNAIESDPGDGQKMIKLISFQEDLVGIKEGKTGRVLRGDPDSGWVTDDSVIGIVDKEFAQFVPNVGICAIVNDQNDFRIYGYDLKWRSTFGGLQISRPIRNIVKDFTPNDTDFFYLNGKLFISGGQNITLVLAVEQNRGWTKYTYPVFGDLTEAVFTFNEGRKAAIVNRNQKTVQIEVDDLDTDYSTIDSASSAISFALTTHRWQFNNGRSIVEQRWLSVVAVLTTNISVQPYVNGRIWDVPFTMVINPEDYPYASLQETEYQGYSEIKPIGNYLHHEIIGNGPCTIYSILLNCLVQEGQIAPGFDPFGILEHVTRVPEWANSFNIKDAGDTFREVDEYREYDAGIESRDISKYAADDAEDTTRSIP